MKKIITWLKESGIEYSANKYGNPDYFDDGFSVDGIQITFYFDGIGNAPEKEKLLLTYMRRKKSYICKRYRIGVGYSYRIMTALDADRLEKHEKAVRDAVEKFWKEEHEKRERKGLTA